MALDKIAVIGTNATGSALAALAANAGMDVVLMGVEQEREECCYQAQVAIEAMKKSHPSPLTHRKNALRIKVGSFYEDSEKLKECDWFIEATGREKAFRQDIFTRIGALRKPHSVLSSAAADVSLKTLKVGLSPELKRDVYLTHFFYPLRQISLLELVTDSDNASDQLRSFIEFLETRLGRSVVQAKDTPGFIANRIGFFWAMWGLEQAIAHQLPIELVDALFTRQFGFPKTGIFGLIDLVGLDVVYDHTLSLKQRLPEQDAFQKLYKAPLLLEKMVQKGLLGDRVGQGFYCRDEDNTLWVIDLETMEYRPIQRPEDEALTQTARSMRTVLEMDTPGGRYVWEVMSHTLLYAVSLVPEITDAPADIDMALRQGFKWERGPLEFIDGLGNTRISGASWLVEACRRDGMQIPPLLEKAAKEDGFYTRVPEGMGKALTLDGYADLPRHQDKWTLAEKTIGQKPLLENASARLWDIGDGIACFEFISPDNTIDHATFDLIEASLDKVAANFQGMIIGNDAKHFSIGMNLDTVRDWCQDKDWDALNELLQRGQQVWLAVKYAPFPVVGAVSGKALGGACDLLLHCDCIQAYSESYIGLNEAGLGLVPSWGGCKEMLIHNLKRTCDPSSQVQVAENVFKLIATSRISNSAEEARSMHILRDCCGITMQRERLLPDAKALCLKHAKDYQHKTAELIAIPQGAAKLLFDKEIELREHSQRLNRHDKRVLQWLAFILSGGNTTSEVMMRLELENLEEWTTDTGIAKPIPEVRVLDLERKAYLDLAKTRETQERLRTLA